MVLQFDCGPKKKWGKNAEEDKPSWQLEYCRGREIINYDFIFPRGDVDQMLNSSSGSRSSGVLQMKLWLREQLPSGLYHLRDLTVWPPSCVDLSDLQWCNVFCSAHRHTSRPSTRNSLFFFQMSDGYSESIHILRKKQKVSTAWNWKVETLLVVWFLWRGTLEVCEELLPRVDSCGFKWSHLEGNYPTQPIKIPMWHYHRLSIFSPMMQFYPLIM